MQKFSRDHETHETIWRLKNNRPISHTDLRALDAIVFGEVGLDQSASKSGGQLLAIVPPAGDTSKAHAAFD